MNSATGSERLIREMLSHLEPPIPLIDEEASSKVANFYKERSVFITGATGFIGKALIEKLVRSCKQIKRIYILVREKRGQNIQERLADLIKSQCFDRIREAHDGSSRLLEEKLHVIQGDITLPKFGIAPSDMKLLSDECTIVFNSAATIRFSEPIDVAVRNNIYSVDQLVNFCDDLKNLEALVHLSTAYANCHKRDTIHEIFYDPPMRGDQILATMDQLKAIEGQIHEYKEDTSSSIEDEATQPLSRSSCKLQRFYPERSAQSSPTGGDSKGASNGGSPSANGNSEDKDELLKEFTQIALRRSNRPNTYTFTKAISETHLLDKVRARPDRYLGSKIPVAVVRPSIVGGAWREPIVGLVDNLNGPTGAILSLYTGVLQAMPGVGQRIADVVPVDMVTNMILCSAWFLVDQAKVEGGGSKSGGTVAEIQHDNGVYMFNFVSGCRNPLRWQVFTENIAELAYKYPSKFLTRLPSSYFVRAGYKYAIYDFLWQRTPAYLTDLVRGKLLCRELDRKTSAMVAYWRIRQITDTLTPFTSNQWRFSDTNVRRLFDSLSPADKSVFHFDVTSIDWQRYIKSYIVGSRIYTLRDEAKNVTQGLAIIKQRKLINNISLAVLLMLVLYFLFATSS